MTHQTDRSSRAPNAVDSALIASPHSPVSAAPSRSHAYASTPIHYPTHSLSSTGLGIGSLAGTPDLRLSVPSTGVNQPTSWHQPTSQVYCNDLGISGRGSWDFNSGYAMTPPATGMPAVSSYPYPAYTHSHRISNMPFEGRFVPLQDFEDHSHDTLHA